MPSPWWHIWPYSASDRPIESQTGPGAIRLSSLLSPGEALFCLSICGSFTHCNYAVSSPTGNRWDWICWLARLNPAERIRSALTSFPVSGYSFPPPNFRVLSSIPSASKASGSLTPFLGQRALSAVFRAVNIMHFFPLIICLLLSPCR